MPRIQPIEPSTATGVTATHFATTRKMLGGIPNLFATAANAPAAFGALLDMFANTGKSSLGGRTGELIAITVAQSNGCGYCLSAHSAIGKTLGLSDAALSSARTARATDSRTEALLQLAKAINESRGHVSDATLADARTAGISDAEIVELVAHVALNVFTNYLNTVAQTTIDFPEVSLSLAA
jgi:uncharacterized peroxidase-related enzyme